MRKISRPVGIACCLLGSAGCAHDGMLAPASGYAAPATPACGGTFVMPCAAREPVYIVDRTVMAGLPANLGTLDIVGIEVLKTTDAGGPSTVRITTRAGGRR